MKIFTLIVRLLFGGMYVFASMAYFFNFGGPAGEMTDAQQKFNEGLGASGYIFPVVKSFELVCGLLILSGFFLPLAAVVIFPITLNIFLYHAFLAPDGLVVSLLLMVANLYLFYAKWDSIKSLFIAKN